MLPSRSRRLNETVFAVSRRTVLGSALAVALLVALFPAYAVEADRLRQHVAWLTNPELAGRRSGQPGAARTAEYLQQQFRELGYNVQLQDFGNNRRNVIARSGTAPRHIVIGAHYDGQSARPSASDNAAGVGLLLEIARELRKATLQVSLVFIAFDDEEQGLNGSRYTPTIPWFRFGSAQAVADLRHHGPELHRSEISATLLPLASEYSPELASLVSKSTRTGMLVAGTDLVGARSDFAPFAIKRIPYLFFTRWTHKDYHGPGDRAELLNYAKLAEDGSWIQRLIVDIAALSAKPTYLAEPVYPTTEKTSLLSILGSIRAERKDLPKGYALVIADMQERIPRDSSRDTLRVASASMLALATPEFSAFLLDAIVGPYYQKLNRPEIAKALDEEAARWR